MESLGSSEQEAQEIVDAIPQAIAVLSPDGQPVYGNRSLLQYTGFTIADVTSADFRARVFHPEDVARLREERRDALPRGVPFEFEAARSAPRWPVGSRLAVGTVDGAGLRVPEPLAPTSARRGLEARDNSPDVRPEE